jgi:ATP-dependent helicase/nuclease subunit A
MPDGTYIATYIVPSNKASDEKDRLREARVAAQQIKRMVTRGDALVLDSTTREYRRPRYGDIALLLRSFKGRLEYFERAFNDEGIPYITLGGQGFYGRREVKDLLCALRALHNPADELELAAALHSPLFAVSDADLLLMRQPFHFEGEEDARTLPLYDALMALAAVRRAESTDYDPVVFSADVLTQLAPMVGRTPVEVLLQSLIHATGYMATLAGLPDGQQMRANVEKLIDRARDSGITALNLFVRHLNDMTEGEAKEGGVALQAENAVRLTTIHSSKGLEYPIVWIADACSESRGNAKSLLNFSGELGCKMPLADQATDPNGSSKDSKLHPYVYRRNNMLAVERDDAETRRILYVAATRAQDALFISGVPNKDSIPGWLGMIAPHIAPEELHPTTPPVREKASATQRVASGAPLDFPLARTLPAAPPPTRLHLSASDIKALGGHFSGPEDRKMAFTRRLRHRIFDEATEPVEMLTYSDEFISAGGRRFGTLVHDALRFGYDTLLHTDEAQVTALLEAMAWELGITQESELQKAVDNALQMLRRYRKSALARELDSAEAVYRELPFVYQRDGHVIHGYIDLLYRDGQGRWTVVDYKTDRVTGGHDGLQEHARIYCLQLAVYAEAVAAQTGQTPRAQLVYLQYPDAPVTFDSEALQSELEKVPLHTLIELLSTETS